MCLKSYINVTNEILLSCNNEIVAHCFNIIAERWNLCSVRTVCNRVKPYIFQIVYYVDTLIPYRSCSCNNCHLFCMFNDLYNALGSTWMLIKHSFTVKQIHIFVYTTHWNLIYFHVTVRIWIIHPKLQYFIKRSTYIIYKQAKLFIVLLWFHIIIINYNYNHICIQKS